MIQGRQTFLSWILISKILSRFLFSSNISVAAAKPAWARETSMSVTGLGFVVKLCHGDETQPKPAISNIRLKQTLGNVEFLTKQCH